MITFRCLWYSFMCMCYLYINISLYVFFPIIWLRINGLEFIFGAQNACNWILTLLYLTLYWKFSKVWYFDVMDCFFFKLCYHPTMNFMAEKCFLPCFWVWDCSFSLSANWIFLLIDSKPNGLFLLRLYCNLYLKMLAIVLKIEIVCCSDLE